MPLADMVTKINAVKSEDDINALKKDMDNFMEKELKVDMTQYKENMEKLEKKLEDAKMKDKIVESVQIESGSHIEPEMD
jgi:Fe2+ transport system protein B